MSYASKIKIQKLRSGGKVLVAAFPAHGRVSMIGSMVGGARLAGNRALAEVHAAMLLEGTTKRDKTAIQIMLDSLGASLSFGVEKDRLVFDAHVRAVFGKKLLALVNEVLHEPTFPQKEFLNLKDRMRAELSLEAQDTRTQATINLSRLLYPEGHPNRQPSTVESLAALEKLTRADVIDYHKRAIDASSLVVALAGDVEKNASFALIESSFAKLPQAHIQLPDVTAVSPQSAAKVSIRIEDKSSIDYMLGIATGITKDSPDYPALLLGLQILGNRSGATGRLMKIVREIEGLTYGVYSYLAGFQNTDGYIVAWATFAPELYERGRAALMREIKKIAEEGATDDEVKKHRAMFEARSRVTLSNSADLARAAHDITIEGHKPSYLDEFPQIVLRLTHTQVNKALKKYLVVKDLSESAAGPVPIREV
jgi:zinc protease